MWCKIICVFLLVFCVSAEEKVPSKVLNLKNWKITLPVNKSGSKKPVEISQPELAEFSHEKHFFVHKKGGVVFRAHCTSVTTKNSKYPRSELREMNGPKRASWDTDKGTHTMEIVQAVTALPKVKKHIVCAQIHDEEDDLIMIRLEDKKLFVESKGRKIRTLNYNYELNTIFSVKISVQNDIIKVYYNDLLKMEKEMPAKGCYFKAGCYTQSNSDKGDGPDSFGEVIIYDLKVSHE